MRSEDEASTPGGAPQGHGGWRPLLEGEESERAWAAIHAVAEALRPEAEREDPPPDATFPDGSAGFALLFAYLARATGDGAWRDCAERLLDQAIDALAERPLPHVLYGGFTGIGWTIEHLAEVLAEEDGEDEPEADEDVADDEDPLTDALLQFLARPTAVGDFDLITGLAGVGVYALEALPRPGARRCLERVIERLAELGEVRDGGLTWFTPPELVPSHQLENAPHGYYNLGVAHGVPAVISLLGACEGAGVLPARRRPMLDDAVRWLLATKRDGEGWAFPAWVGEGVQPNPGRLAWCYGDPGVAAALFTAARHARQERWEAEALEVARRGAVRPLEQSGVQDAGLCHGSAGLAHLFHRMHRASGDPALADAARFWFRHTLDLWRPGTGCGGFLAYSRPGSGAPRWRADPGFLTGSTGVALALLAAVSPPEPNWDRVLAVSVPTEPRPGGRSGRP